MKTYRIAFTVLLFAIMTLAGCSEDTTVEPKSEDPLMESKSLMVRHFSEVWNEGNLEVFDEIATADFVLHLGSLDIPDAADYKQFVTMYRTAFPDIHFAIDEQFAEMDKVVSRFSTTGTHEGSLMGIPPTNVQIITTGNSIFRFADGKIAEGWLSFDELGILQQLGVIPQMGRTDFTWGTPSELSGDPGNPTANKAMLKEMLDEVWGNSNLAVIDDIFNKDYILHDPVVPIEVIGPEGFQQYCSMMIAAVPECSFTSPDFVVDGNKICVRWEWSGTQVGELMGIPATGKQIMIKGITIHRFVDGKFVESYFSYDMLGMLRELGIVPTFE